MERSVFAFKIKTGKYSEYKKRHDEIWSDLINEFKKAGRTNFSIWHANNLIFGYYEAENMKHCKEILSHSEIVKNWNDYMDDIIDPLEDENKKIKFEEIFYQT